MSDHPNPNQSKIDQELRAGLDAIHTDSALPPVIGSTNTNPAVLGTTPSTHSEGLGAGTQRGNTTTGSADGNPPSTMEGMMKMIQQMAAAIASLQAQSQSQTQTQGVNSVGAVSLGGPPAATELPQGGAAPVVIENLPTKRRLGDLKDFDGTKKHYRAWKLAAQSKLAYDGHLIGDDKAQLAYLFMHMDPDAQIKVQAYYEVVQIKDAYTPQQFIEYLDSIHLDPNEADRALQQLDNLRQGDHQSFASFFPSFETIMAEANLSTESDRVKISYLDRALNEEIRRGMLGKVRGSYLQYAAQLQMVGSQLDAINMMKHRTGGQGKGESNAGQSSTIRNKDNIKGKGQGRNTLDTRTRAEWVSKEEHARRLNNGLCIRCAQTGHASYKCHLAPAQRPNHHAVEAKKADSIHTAGKVEELDDSDQGKE